MNIQIQVTAAAFVCLFIFFYIMQPKLGIASEALFFRMLVICFVTLVFDFTSIIAIVYSDRIPPFVTEFFCKGYLVLLVVNCIFALLYTLQDEKLNIPDVAFKIIFVLTMIDLAAICASRIYYYHDKDFAYSYGTAPALTYLGAGCLIIGNLLFCIFNRKRMTKLRNTAIISWMSVWTFSALIQFFNAKVLVVGLGCAMGSVILFYWLENPDSNMDKTFNCFNANALQKYIKYLIRNKKNDSIVVLDFGEYALNDSRLMEYVISEYTEKKRLKVFKNLGPEVWIGFPNHRELEEYRTLLKNIVEYEQIRMLTIPNVEFFKSNEDLTRTLQYLEITDSGWTAGCERILTEDDIAAITKESEIKHEILEAMRHDRIEAFVQPIYSVAEGKFTSGEVLARIKLYDGSFMPPSDFIPVAERNGLIKEMGNRIFEKACKMMRDDDLGGFGVEYLDVNLAVDQCESEELIRVFERILGEYHLDAKSFNLEITETGSIKNKEYVSRNLSAMKELGFSFSLDDFGSGESNLNYILQMPVSVIKLDKNMIDACEADSDARAIVRHVTIMAHDMGMKIVAEGIETLGQLNRFTDLGIDYIQGYYFSKPLPREEYVRFVHEHA